MNTGRSTAAGVVAAFSVVFAVPLWFLAAGDGGLGELLERGGFAVKLVLPAALLGACIQGLLVMRGDAGLAAPLAPLVPLGAGAAGFFHGGVVAFGLAPHDRLNFLLIVLADSASCLVLGACAAAVLWLGQAAALLLAPAPPTRLSRLPLAIAMLGLGAWTLLDGGRLAAMRHFLRHMSGVSLVDAPAGDVAGFERAARIGGLAALALFVVALALALRSGRADRPRVFIGAAIAGFTLLCALGVQALELYTLRKLEGGVVPRPAGELAFASGPTTLGEDLGLEGRGRTYPPGGSWAKALADARSRSGGWNTGRSALIVRLYEATRLDDVAGLLDDARRDSIDEIVFVGRTLPPELPPSRTLALLAPGLIYDATVFVNVTPAGGRARLAPTGVEIDGALLPFIERDVDRELPGAATLPLEGLGGSRELVRAVRTLQVAGYSVALTR